LEADLSLFEFAYKEDETQEKLLLHNEQLQAELNDLKAKYDGMKQDIELEANKVYGTFHKFIHL